MELATKRRPLVPEEFRDDICPIPPKEIVEKYAKDKNAKKGRPEKTKFEKMKVTELKEDLRKLNLSVKGLNKIL